MAYCSICGTTTKFGNSRSRSMQRTSRTMKPNLQKVGGVLLCTRCLRTIRKKVAEAAEVKTEAVEVQAAA